MNYAKSSGIVTSLVFWTGIVLFAVLKWNLPNGRPPETLPEFIAVGACVAGAVLLFAEAGAWMMSNRMHSVADRAFGTVMLLSAITLAIGLVAHSIWTYHGELVVALFCGSVLYLFFLRNPFVALTKL